MAFSPVQYLWPHLGVGGTHVCVGPNFETIVGGRGHHEGLPEDTLQPRDRSLMPHIATADRTRRFQAPVSNVALLTPGQELVHAIYEEEMLRTITSTFQDLQHEKFYKG